MFSFRKKQKKKPLYRDMLFQVVAAILLGVAFGHLWPEIGAQMKPLADAFIRLITMVIAPIIFCTIVTGVAGMGDMKQVGRIGVKALIYFEVVTTLALIIGLVVVNVLQPGMGMTIDPSAVDTGAVQAKMGDAHMQSATEFFLGMIPKTLVGAFAGGEILQVLVISLLFSAALSALGEKGKPVVQGIDAVSHVLFGMIGIIIRVAPIGAFGAMAYTIGKHGIGSLAQLGILVLIFYATCIAFVALVLGGVLRWYCKLPMIPILRYFKDELVIVLGTSSSETVLPRMIDKLTALGCRKSVVGVVIPTGYSFNLDGSCISLTICAVFICFATGTDITLWHQITLLGVLLLTSKGAAGVTGSAFIVLAATMQSLNIVPPEMLSVGLALVFAVDRFLSTGRALTNLVGNAVATLVIAKWEDALDMKQVQAVLSGRKEPKLETAEQ